MCPLTLDGPNKLHNNLSDSERNLINPKNSINYMFILKMTYGSTYIFKICMFSFHLPIKKKDQKYSKKSTASDCSGHFQLF